MPVHSLSEGRGWRIVLSAILLLLLFLASRPASAAAVVPGDPGYVPGEVLIGWRAGSGVTPNGATIASDDHASAAWQSAAAALAGRSGLRVLDVHPALNMGRLAVTPGQEQAEIARLKAQPWVQFAEPNYLAYALGTPNDPYFYLQWNMSRVQGPAAWDVTSGSSSVIVAVIDSGIDTQHPEFTGRLLAGVNYIDVTQPPNDDCGHGTHVAGIIAAAANNGMGVAGVAPLVRIDPLKVLAPSSNGCGGDYGNIVAAIDRAVNDGAQVINMSVGGTAASDYLHNAIINAVQHNVVVVAAAGNDGDKGNPDIYPAAYAETIAVGATDINDNVPAYSEYKSYVDIAAPGGAGNGQVLSTVPTGAYGYMSGTSMATPMVSGAAALVRTLMPGSPVGQVTGILETTADKVGPYAYINNRNDYYGYGRLNLAAAVRRAGPPVLSAGSSQVSYLLGTGRTAQTATVSVLNVSEQDAAWSAVPTVGWLTVVTPNGHSTYSQPGTLTLRANRGALPPGTYDGVVQVTVGGSLVFNVYATLKVSDNLKFTMLPVIMKSP